MSIPKHHILYIEDDVVDQMAFKRMAREYETDFCYTIAADIKTARQLIDKNQFSAVVTDYHLGINNAFEIIPYIKDAPIILVTGGGDESLAVKAMKMGASDYLIKDDNYDYLKFLPISVQNAIEHYEAKAQLIETRNLYQLLVETASDVIYKGDVKGYCTYVNEIGEKVTGFTRDEIIGRHFTDLVSEKHKSKVSEFYFNHFKESKKTSYLEFSIVRKDGTEIWVGQNVSTIYSSDDRKVIVGFQGVVRDITEKKLREDYIETQRLLLEKQNEEIRIVQKLQQDTNNNLVSTNQNLEKIVEERTRSLSTTNEELKSINHELDMFIYRASHDLKAPIARIQGLANLAMTEAKTPQLEQYIRKLTQSAREMNAMLAKLQAVNEIKQHEIKKRYFSLHELVSGIVKGFDSELATQHIKLQINVDKSLRIYADRYLLQQVINPIIENAIVFHKRNGKDDRLIEFNTQVGDNSAIISVWDNGLGIGDECISNVFDIFFRGSEISRGNGLGLHLSTKAAEKLGISLNVDSELGVYTKTEVILPLDMVDKASI